MIEKLDGTSLDISAENRAQLKQLFPAVFTETKNDKGELVESIDFERLKAELGKFSDLFESRKERYGMDWPGKKEALKLIQAQSYATLKPCREESVNFDTTENLFIEGDNLEVLKLLQKSYYGKVKMMYFDPPYNTGKEFIYPDNYSESLETYLEYAGLTDGDGKKFSTNTANEGRFHTKWLNMMYPRLYLARNLLRDDGVIFISIDDNEVSNLRKLCDEIFGEENFVAQFIWKRRSSSAMSQNSVSNDHEYVMCFQKGCLIGFSGNEKDFKNYANPDNDPRGPWVLGDLTVGMTASMRPNQAYDLVDPKTGIKYPYNQNRVWAFIPESMNKMIAEERIIFPKDITKRPMQKRFQNELKSNFNPFSTIMLDNVGLNTEATRIIQDVMGRNVFDYSKPLSLIKTLITQMSSDSLASDIILDIFAGSATTAHAVLDLNKQDGGNRKFILVQLPEPCAPDSEAFKAGYKTIADIGKERIRRVIKKVDSEQWKVISKEEKIKYGCKELSRADCLAKVNGVVQADLFSGQETSERGTLQFVGSDAPGGSINSIEHSGRSSAQFNQRISSVSSDSKGIKSGAGDSASSMCESRIPCRYGYFGSDAAITGDRENAGCSFKNTVHCPLTTNHSIDSGFKVFKLDKSNFKQWQKLEPSTVLEQIVEQLELHIDHISHKATPEDLLYEILLKSGFKPTEKVETKTLAGQNVFSVADGALLLCLEESVSKELIDAVANAEPMQFICLDSAFHGNDQLKANAVQTFAARNMQKEKHNQIIFKTV